jgi:asparagine synthase (glutamine-hydrolysing)
MCGIAGIAGFRDGASIPSSTARMARALSRRGPDGEGMYQWSGAALAHRRLAIFDLSAAGCQPMLSADKSVGITFNGAIYNFRALRQELESAGISFHSQTDTEVLVEGYRVWGIDELVRRIRGMFAFGLWDDRARTLFLVRDRLGVKPLVYSVSDGVLRFASTARALRAAGVDGELDDRAVADVLEYGFVDENHSIYRNVHKLPPATILEFSDGRVSTRRYWAPPRPTGEAVAFEDALDRTKALFLEAVRRRLDADVPVGALLSGGIDSALVCWAFNALGADITAFTVGTPGTTSDETSDAVQTAREIGLRHEVLPMHEVDASMMQELVDAYPEPFACSSALGMLNVSRAVSRSTAKVLLTGDGGDDVFLGYGRHLMMRRIQNASRFIPRFSTVAWRALRGGLPHRGMAGRAVHAIDYATGGLGAFVAATPGLPALRRAGILGPRLLGTQVEGRALPWRIESARGLLQEYLDYDLQHQFVAEYLTKVDGATMYVALEARSPFLDTDLWEYASTLPADTRLHRGRLKAILRELARRNISERVARGSKRGFTIPVEQWIAGRWYQEVRRLFEDSVLEREGWVHSSAIRADLDRAHHHGVAPTRLWYLYVLESWMRREQNA